MKLTKNERCAAIGCLSLTAFLLIVILIPLSFSYVDYYDYGLKKSTTTGAVDTSTVYTRGRYRLGPTYTFIKYKADAHHVSLEDLAVFSAGGSNESIGTSFKLDIDLTYLLIKDEIGELHREIASTYEDVIVSRAVEAIKNEAIYITFTEYFQERREVERRLRDAVQKRWSETRLHCTLDQFHVGEISIPEEVAEKQLESKVQNERNDREAFMQQAQIERELTDVEVNAILLERNKVLRTAEAQASLTRAKATAEAQKAIQDAQNAGAMQLFNASGITEQEHKIAFAYIRTLMDREDNTTTLDVSYLNPENVLKTKLV